MLGDQTSAAIRAAWQARIEAHLEADQTPVLQLGMEHEFLNGARGLLALQALATAREDITAPVVVAGGASSLWLAALMHGRRPVYPEGSPNVRVIFAGSDAATYMASRTLYSNGDSPLSRDALLRPPAELPPAMVRWLAPTADPGVNAPGETLPIYAAVRAVRAQIDSPVSATTRSTIYPNGAPPVQWTAYAAIMLAVIMVLAAVVLSLQP